MSLPRAAALLRDYVAIPSVNPMGRDDIPESIAGETRYAEHVAAQLRALGLDAALVGSGNRKSVIATASHPEASETVLVASHLDTVPVDGMEIEPFDPAVREGRVYGRGSCDTKGGLAALLAALEGVLERGRLRRNVIVVGEADEEFGSVGVEDVLRHLGVQRPDWVIATEPTDLRVVNCHKGVAVAKLHASGRACHSSEPGAGRNAIVAMALAALALDAYAAEELAARVDPKLGVGTLSIGLAGGGHAPNIVPDRAWLVADRRLLPGESPASACAEIEAALARRGVEDVVVESCRGYKPALGADANAAATEACRAALGSDAPEATGVAFGTDAGVFAEAGIPGVVIGPGSIREAHTARESVPVAEVEAMAAFFARLLGR